MEPKISAAGGERLRGSALFIFPLVAACACMAVFYGRIERCVSYQRLRMEVPRGRLEALAGEACGALADSFRSAAVYAAPPFEADTERGVAVRLISESGDRACLAYWRGMADLPAAARAVAYAARSDPRYRPVREDELSTLRLELSIFGGFVPAGGPFDFLPGKETLMVVNNGDPTLIQAGAMTDLGISKLGYVRALCRKAGLEEDAWKCSGLLWYRAPTIRSVRPVEPSGGR